MSGPRLTLVKVLKLHRAVWLGLLQLHASAVAEAATSLLSAGHRKAIASPGIRWCVRLPRPPPSLGCSWRRGVKEPTASSSVPSLGVHRATDLELSGVGVIAGTHRAHTLPILLLPKIHCLKHKQAESQTKHSKALESAG